MNRLNTKQVNYVCAAAGVVAVLGVTAAFAFPTGNRLDDKLSKNLQAAFPRTKITAVNCDFRAVKGLCEVVAGKNVFYSTKDGQHVFIGEILDLQGKTNLTSTRLSELASIAGAEDKISGAPGQEVNAAAAAQTPPAAPAQVIQVNLPKENAVVHNPGAPLKLTVFADYSCHFCQQLFNDLRSHPEIEITEYPIAILGPDSETKAKQVLCAGDRTSAANALYYGGELKTRGECQDGADRLAQNLAFARSHGITGTPMLIRRDGVTNSGWMPGEKLVAWLKGVRA